MLIQILNAKYQKVRFKYMVYTVRKVRENSIKILVAQKKPGITRGRRITFSRKVIGQGSSGRLFVIIYNVLSEALQFGFCLKSETKKFLVCPCMFLQDRRQ